MAHSFLSTWSPLGLAYKNPSEQEDIPNKLDILFRRCLGSLRDNKLRIDEMLSLADKGKDAVTSHAFEVLSNKQKTSAIGISNYLKEASLLNKKLPKDREVLKKSEYYIGQIRSELQGINSTVEKCKNALILLGIKGLESTDKPLSYAIIPESQKILKADYKFPALSDQKTATKTEHDPHFSQLVDRQHSDRQHADFTGSSHAKEDIATFTEHISSVDEHASHRFSGLEERLPSEAKEVREALQEKTQLGKIAEEKSLFNMAIDCFVRTGGH